MPRLRPVRTEHIAAKVMNAMIQQRWLVFDGSSTSCVFRWWWWWWWVSWLVRFGARDSDPVRASPPLRLRAAGRPARGRVRSVGSSERVSLFGARDTSSSAPPYAPRRTRSRSSSRALAVRHSVLRRRSVLRLVLLSTLLSRSMPSAIELAPIPSDVQTPNVVHEIETASIRSPRIPFVTASPSRGWKQ